MRIIRTKLRTYAFSVAPLNAVVTGLYFDCLTAKERAAVLSHEEAHLVQRHAQTRLKWLLTFQWIRHLWLEKVRAQEYEADAYAVGKGHADGLVSFLSRSMMRQHEDSLHPSPTERIERIFKLLQRT